MKPNYTKIDEGALRGAKWKPLPGRALTQEGMPAWWQKGELGMFINDRKPGPVKYEVFDADGTKLGEVVYLETLELLWAGFTLYETYNILTR